MSFFDVSHMLSVQVRPPPKQMMRNTISNDAERKFLVLIVQRFWWFSVGFRGVCPGYPMPGPDMAQEASSLRY